MGAKTRIVKNGLLVKIYWKDDIEKNEKKTAKERIVQENEGKLCIVFQRNLSEYVPNSIVTVIPQQHFRTITTASIKFYETEGYKTEQKENNINIISNESNDDLKISLKIFKQTTEKQEKGQKITSLFEIIFGSDIQEAEVDPTSEVTPRPPEKQFSWTDGATVPK